jgi:hypothetical protein
MSVENFLALQEELWWAFGWLARWWLILFAFGGTALAALMFFLSVVSSWQDSK